MEKKEIMGRNPVLEYLRTLESGLNAELHISNSAHGKIIDIIKNEAYRRNIRTNFQDKSFFSKLGSSSRHQGVLLTVHGPTAEIKERDLLDKVFEDRGVLVVLDRLTDPHNIGSIIRSAEALGASGVVLPKAHSPSQNSTIIKTSAGATAYLKTITVPNIAQFLDNAKQMGFWIIGTSDMGESSLEEVSDLKPAILIIGSEESGMRRLSREKCDHEIKIPLKGKIGSLNASVAAGIVLYELLKK